MGGSKGFDIRRGAALCVHFCLLAAVLLCVCGCGEQLTRMEENQVRLQAMVAANAREIATLSSQVHTGQAKLGEGIQNLDARAQGIAAGVQTVQGDQTRLHETVVAGHQNLDAKATALHDGQRSLQASVTGVQGTADRAVSDLAALSQRHTVLHETVQANQRELDNHMGVVVTNQQGIQAGIVRLHEADAGLARDVAAVAGKQDALSTAMQDSDRQVAARLTSLAGGHDKLSADVATVADKQTALHTTVLAGNQTLGDKLAILEQNQLNHQTGIDRVFATANQTAATIAAIAAAQTAMQESLTGNHAALTAQIDTSRQSLQAGIDTLNTKTDKAASDSAAATASLQDTLRISRDVVTGQMAASIQNQQAIQAAVQEVNGKADGLAGNLSTVSTAAAANHQDLKAGIADLGVKTQQVSADVTAVAAVQNDFRRMQQGHNESSAARTAGLAEGQQALRNQVDTLTAVTNQTALSMLTLNNGQATFQQAMQTGMNGLHDRANQTAADVHGMAERQAAFQESIRTSNESLTAQAAAVAENQQALKADLGKAANVIDRAYADLTAVALAQETLQGTLTGRSDEISSRVTRIENNQRTIADNLDVLTATTGQTALDVLGLANGHADLQQGIRTSGDAVLAQTTAIAENQKSLASHLDVLTATTGQTSLDVLTLNNDQSKLARTVRTGLADLTQRTDHIAAGQEKTQGSVDVLTATAGQTALDVIAVTNRQDTLQKAMQNHTDSAAARMAGLAENQHQTQSTVDALAVTTGQTAKDVTGIADRQDGLRRAIQSHDESVGGRIANLSENQQKMQAGLDAVAATTGQTVSGIVAVNEAQAKSEQAAQAGRTEVTAKLAEIAQTQQGWLQRFDTAQARIQAMVDGIAAIDQQLAKLQGTLQAGVQNTTALLDKNGQQRQQFEAKVAQDVQAMIDALAQLRQAQAHLQEQMAQVQRSTQSQAETLKATIDQMKQPPAEVKVSDAAKPAEPPVVETGE